MLVGLLELEVESVVVPPAYRHFDLQVLAYCNSEVEEYEHSVEDKQFDFVRKNSEIMNTYFGLSNYMLVLL